MLCFFLVLLGSAELITVPIEARWLEEELVFPPKYNDNAGKNLHPGLQGGFLLGCQRMDASWAGSFKHVQCMIGIRRHDRHQLMYKPMFKNVWEVLSHLHRHNVLSLPSRTPFRVFFF